MFAFLKRRRERKAARIAEQQATERRRIERKERLAKLESQALGVNFMQRESAPRRYEQPRQSYRETRTETRTEVDSGPDFVTGMLIAEALQPTYCAPAPVVMDTPSYSPAYDPTPSYTPSCDPSPSYDSGSSSFDFGSSSYDSSSSDSGGW